MEHEGVAEEHPPSFTQFLKIPKPTMVWKDPGVHINSSNKDPKKRFKQPISEYLCVVKNLQAAHGLKFPHMQSSCANNKTNPKKSAEMTQVNPTI